MIVWENNSTFDIPGLKVNSSGWLSPKCLGDHHWNPQARFDYKEELEYLNVEHLLYSAGLRFAQFKDGYELLLKCIDIINNKYKNFKNNKYYKEKSFKFKLICNLTYHKHFKLLKYIGKLRG